MEKKPTLETLIEQIVETKISEVLGSRAKALPEVKDPEKWLSVPQAAREFGCNRHTLDKAIARNEIDIYKPDDRNTYVKRGDVSAFLETIRIRSRENMNGYSFLKNKQ